MKSLVRSFSRKEDVEIVAKKTVYQGYFRIDRYQLRYRQFEGGWGPVCTRELFERGHAVAVLPYDPVKKRVVLIEQFRIGAMEDERSPWLLEIVAGIIEPGETTEVVAQRETNEEAGLEMHELRSICKYWTSPGGATESVELFCGAVDSDLAGSLCGMQEECEDIKVHVVDYETAFQMVRDGTINSSPAIIALQWLELNLRNKNV